MSNLTAVDYDELCYSGHIYEIDVDVDVDESEEYAAGPDQYFSCYFFMKNYDILDINALRFCFTDTVNFLSKCS